MFIGPRVVQGLGNAATTIHGFVLAGKRKIRCQADCAKSNLVVMRRAMLTILLAVVALCGNAVVWADQKDPRLDELFARLKSTDSLLEAHTIEGDIWSIWLTSSNEEVNNLMAQGVTAMNRGDFISAVKDFTEIIEIAPDFAEGWNKRATVLYLLDDYAGSKDDVDKVLALEPRHFGALAGLGLIYGALEQEEDAIAAFERALAVHPFMSNARENIELMRDRIKKKSI
jgi:tetratricopeptide (TPR) repeat protein